MTVYACLSLAIILLSILCLFCKRKFNYWSDKNVKGPTPWPVVGNFGNVMLQKKSVNQCLKDIHLKYKGEKLVGLYRGFQPMVLVRDPELIKHVLIKDFHYFPNRGMSTSSSRLSDNLFSAEGEKWKLMRQKLTPVFTTRKLRDMMPIIQECIENFLLLVDRLVDKNVDYEIREMTAKYTMKIVVKCAFGLEIDTYSNEKNEFTEMAKKIFQQSWSNRLLTVVDMIIPGIKKAFVTSTDIQNYFVGLVREVVKEREGKPSERKDFMDFMIELKEQGRISRNITNGVAEIEIDDYMLAAQAFVFYSAGYETSSATMSFMIHELALNPQIQDRVYEEICFVTDKYNGDINYDSISQMKYLEMIFDETLRKYTVAGVLFRKSSSNYTFQGTNVMIEKNTPVLISVSGLTADHEYFPEPNKFEPDNFLSQNLNKLSQCVYLPFGDGPRNCIGRRFAKVITLLCMAAFIKKFKVEPTANTKRDLTFNPKGMILVSNEGIWTKISRRET
ncbi:unnamed protein product [Diatraea saccharalis]|uniref:unspecific monooxygenase n=1 Tax=Diatraea saccharalis TaxID=40085 RepID=A0A9N9R1T7_9NEOP|nr:unnamed protein product [Diatraea saccharalis]